MYFVYVKPTVIDYDGVLVMDRGRVETYGPPAVLLGAVGVEEMGKELASGEESSIKPFREELLRPSPILQEFVRQGGKSNEDILRDISFNAYRSSVQGRGRPFPLGL